eukprot:4512_1
MQAYQKYDVDHKTLLLLALILFAPLLYTIHCIGKPFSHCKHCILGHGFWRHLVDCFTFKRLSYQFKFLDMIALSVRHTYLLTTVSLHVPMDSTLLFHFRMGVLSILFIGAMCDHYKDIKQSKGSNKYYEYNPTQIVIIVMLMICALCYLIWLYFIMGINMMIPFLMFVILVLIYKKIKRIFQVVAFKNIMDALVPPCVYIYYYMELQQEEEYILIDIVAWITSVCCLLFASSIIFDCRDIVEDEYNKVKTLAVVHGIPTTLWIALLFNAVTVLIQCLYFGGNTFGLIAVFLGSVNLWCIINNNSIDEYFHLYYLFLVLLIIFT